ncbi:hypothetical protein IFM61606_10501 [Aspergillus udagawae]|nr:hypothetical protein IFM61606_10501 [Aspergillus udagawae]
MEIMPIGPDLLGGPDLDPDVTEAWQNMRDRLQDLATLSNGQEYDPNLEKEGVLASLERIQNPGRRGSERMKRVKEIFSGTLNVIQRVGGIAADAASQIFAPASQCYNAINFVIGAWQEYQGVFDILNDLFRECAGFLVRLEEYARGGMNKGLRNVACRALKHFVDICEKAVMLSTSRTFKTMTLLRIAFLSRNEFQDLMTEMNRITKEEAEQAIATIYGNTQESVRFTKMNNRLLEDQSEERALDKQAAKDKSRLLDTLAFDPNSELWDQNLGEPNPTWRTTYNNILQQQVPGTGEWLFIQHPFTAWADKGDSPILGIVGGESSGKSYLVSSAIHHLRTPDSNKDLSSRRLVAFYFLDSKKADAGLEGLGKSIIWQFAQSDASYMRSASWACKKGAIDPKDLLTELLLKNREELNKIDVTFFIVINKIGNSDDEVDGTLLTFLQRVSHSRRKSVRILFTATQGTIQKLARKGFRCPIISMNSNADDVSKYIDARLNGIDVLADVDNNDIANIRREIHAKLLAITKGNFYLMNRYLNDISGLDYDQEMFDVLDAPHDSLTDRIDKDIHRLNKDRTDSELREINTIILWITFARERMTAEKMKAVLQFENKATSLRPLEERLSQKFLLFEIDNDGYVAFKSEQIAEKIPPRARNISEREKDNTIVQTREVDIVRHFFKTVCPPQLVDKLELESYFEDKMRGGRAKIYKEHRTTAHFKLAKACLHVLASDGAESFRVLRGYAARNLIHHMSEAQLALIDHDLKEQVAVDLVKLFRDGPSIDNLFWAKKETPHLPNWFFNLESGNMVCRWLEDTSPLAKHDDKDKQWLRELLGAESTTDMTIMTLVEPSIIRMAENCFQMKALPQNTFYAFQIVKEYLSRFGVVSPPIEAANVEDWCLRKLQVRERDSLWHCQMAFVLKGLRDTSASQARCRKALELDPNNWRASFLLATNIEGDAESKKILKRLIHHYKDNVNWMKQNKRYFAEMAYRVGSWYWNDKQLEKAMSWYSAFEEQRTEQYFLYFNIISCYYSEEKWESMASILEKLRSDSRLTRMVISLEDTPANEEFDLMVLHYVLHTEDYQMLDHVYQDAINLTARKHNHRASFRFRRAYAAALSAKPTVSLDQVTKLLEAAAKDVPYTGLNMADAFFRVGYRLGTIYLDKAKQAKSEGKDKEAELCLRKMADVVPEQVLEAQMRLPLRLFAARYHTIQGNEKAARLAVHNTLKMAVELLADRDSTNDMLAYAKILNAVTAFGDEEHARTAWYMMRIDNPIPGGFVVSCSCPCGFRSGDPGGMWRCKDCINVVLTTGCKVKVENGTISYICHASHEHFPIRTWEGGEIGEGGVPWKDRIITMDEWREKLISKYNLK